MTEWQPPTPTKQKVPYRHIPFETLAEVAWVMALGAKKHGEYDYYEKSDPDEYFEKIMRHVIEWRTGRKSDEESGRHPLAHAIADCMIAILIDRKQHGENHVDG